MTEAVTASGTGSTTGLGGSGVPLPVLLETVGSGCGGSRGSLLAYDVGGTKVRAALASASCEVLAERVEPTDGADTGRILRQLAGLAAALRDEAGVASGPVRRAVVGVPATLDARTGASRFSANVPGLEVADLPARLAESLGVEVDVENDVNLAAAGERWQGAARDVEDFVLLNVGTGVGAGLVLAGDVYRGQGGAGEVAHLPFNGSGPRLSGGAPFEDAVAPAAALSRWRELTGGAEPDGASAERDMAGLLAAAGRGDPAARQAVREQADLLAAGVAALLAVLDLPLVVLAGGLGGTPPLADGLRTRLAATGFRTRVVTTALGDRAGLLGALLLAAASRCGRVPAPN